MFAAAGSVVRKCDGDGGDLCRPSRSLSLSLSLSLSVCVCVCVLFGCCFLPRCLFCVCVCVCGGLSS